MPLFFGLMIGAGVLMMLVGFMAQSNTSRESDATAYGIVTAVVGIIGEFCLWGSP